MNDETVWSMSRVLKKGEDKNGALSALAHIGLLYGFLYDSESIFHTKAFEFQDLVLAVGHTSAPSLILLHFL